MSTFKIAKLGEARLHYGRAGYAVMENLYTMVSKSQLFEPLPSTLANFDKWVPSFKLVDGVIGPIRVVFQPKPGSDPNDIEQWQTHQATLSQTWWETVLIPAVGALPPDTWTRRFNTTATFQSTHLKPIYIRVCKEDITALDQTLANATQNSTLDQNLEWYFLCEVYGQRQLLQRGEELGPESFGLGSAFDLSNTAKFSAHIALNVKCIDPAYSLFWYTRNTFSWSGRHGKSTLYAPTFQYVIYS